MADDLELGPVDYLVVRFPGSRLNGEAFPLLVDLADRGIIRILDLAVVKREFDGSLTMLALSDLDGDGTLDLTVFQGAASGLLDDDDAQQVASTIEPGDAAAMLVYENTWAAPFASALLRSGAELVASARIPVTDLVAAIDLRDSADV